MNKYNQIPFNSVSNYLIPQKAWFKSGRVIWITGLSGSGKTSLAIEMSKVLAAEGIHPILLDGDEMRKNLFGNIIPEDNYSNKSRKTFGKAYSDLSYFLASQGFIVITSVIAMFEEVFSWNKVNLPGYFEIYLKTSLSDLRNENSKGIYSDFEKGIINNLPGVNLKIDEPKKPNLILEKRSNFSAQEKANEVISLLKNKRYFE